jgi:hypothetical protein
MDKGLFRVNQTESHFSGTRRSVEHFFDELDSMTNQLAVLESYYLRRYTGWSISLGPSLTG